MNFKEFFNDFPEIENLEEKLILFNKKAYPKFGNVVIMAGGAGSGKGHILKHLVGMAGHKLDVDELKRLAGIAPKIIKRSKEEFGVDIEKMSRNLKNPDNVSKLHYFVADSLRLDSRRKTALFTSVLTAHPDRKPNLIFDVTLKNLSKLRDISNRVASLGYDKKNIHIVWVVNDVEVALKQNQERDRVVHPEILMNTHRGVSATMQDVLSMGKSINKFMDGDIVFAFNKINVDTDMAKSDKGGTYVKDANYIYVKRAGKPPMSVDQISKDLRHKIQSYVPKNVDWI